MPSIYDLKPRFQDLLRPICRGLAALGVSANAVTMAAMGLSLASGLILSIFPNNRWALAQIPAVLFLRMALNAIDGMLAREHDMKSALGAVLNEMGDVFSDAVLYLPFALIPGVNASLVVALVILAVMVEMVGVVSVQIGGTRRYDGPMGKSDRAFLFGLLALLLAASTGALLINLLLGMGVALSAITLINRANRAVKEAV